MSYPPGNPGYPPAQSPGSYGAPAGSSFAKTGDANGNLKHYLTVAVAVLGVIAYLASYGVGRQSDGAGGLVALLCAVSVLAARRWDATARRSVTGTSRP